MKANLFYPEGDFAGTVDVDIESNPLLGAVRLKEDMREEFRVREQWTPESGDYEISIQLRMGQFPSDFPSFKPR